MDMKTLKFPCASTYSVSRLPHSPSRPSYCTPSFKPNIFSFHQPILLKTFRAPPSDKPKHLQTSPNATSKDWVSKLKSCHDASVRIPHFICQIFLRIIRCPPQTRILRTREWKCKITSLSLFTSCGLYAQLFALLSIIVHSLNIFVCISISTLIHWIPMPLDHPSTLFLVAPS